MDEIDRLREECAIAYQVVGNLAERAGVFETHAVERVLDNLWAAAEGKPRIHENILPFIPEERE